MVVDSLVSSSNQAFDSCQSAATEAEYRYGTRLIALTHLSAATRAALESNIRNFSKGGDQTLVEVGATCPPTLGGAFQLTTGADVLVHSHKPPFSEGASRS